MYKLIFCRIDCKEIHFQLGATYIQYVVEKQLLAYFFKYTLKTSIIL